jgi:hypothetical protein
MDTDIKKLIKQVIKDDLGVLVSQELEERLRPFLKIVDEIRTGQDKIIEQLREDRKDINDIKIGQTTTNKQNKVIIENQNLQEETLINAVKEETKTIPEQTEKAILKIFDKKPLYKRIREKFIKAGGKK